MSLAPTLAREGGPPAVRTAMPAWRRIVRNNWIYALLLTPGFALLLLFFHYPALQAVRYAFYEWNGEQRIFIGFGNFRDLWHDPVFRDMLLAPSNRFRMREGLIAILAGNVHGDASLRVPMTAFRTAYFFLKTLQPLGIRLTREGLRRMPAVSAQQSRHVS